MRAVATAEPYIARELASAPPAGPIIIAVFWISQITLSLGMETDIGSTILAPAAIGGWLASGVQS